MIKAILTRKPTVVLSIVKINIIVFLLWWIVPMQFMMDNFLVSWNGLLQGKVWTLLTSEFSHNMFFHIFINMYAFLGFGTVLENVMGQKKFLKFYIIAGITASLTHALVSAFLIHDPSLPALGASGAISGVILLFSLMFPQEKILLMGIVPIPAIFASALIIGLDMWGLFEQTRGGTLPIGHGAHLGGAFYGLVYYLLVVKRGRGLRYSS